MSFPAQGYTPTEPTGAKNQTVIGERTGAIVGGTDAFTPDLTPQSTVAGEQAIFSILVCFNKATQLTVSFDSFATFCILNGGLDILEKTLFLFEFPVAHGESFNIRFADSDDILVLRVGEALA